MNWLEIFLGGAIEGLGMWLVMTGLGIGPIFIFRKRIIKFVAKLWVDIKEESIKKP